jgi:DNA-binding NarL/FixJ family response regulator
VLYLSGYSDETLIDQGIAAVPANFIQKPFSSDVLRKRIRSLLEAP